MTSGLSVRNVGIIAHIDAGKTTLSERILYYTHKEHALGEVDSGTAALDWMPEEQRRGITITAAATKVAWREHEVNLIDTPGHVDFTAEVERSLRVLDGAVGVFCGAAGVQAQSETVWRQADRYGVPRLAFVNKLDRRGADFLRVVEGVRARLKAPAIPIQLPIGREKAFEGVVDLVEWRALRFEPEKTGERVVESPIEPALEADGRAWRTRLCEAAADFDEELLERYVSGGDVPAALLKRAIRKGTCARGLVPVLCGAALRNKGVQPVLDAICDYLPAPEELGPIEGWAPGGAISASRMRSHREPLTALAFKTVADLHGDLVYLRIYSGVLEEGQQVWNSRIERKERAPRLFIMHANHREPIQRAEAGAIIAVVGFKETSTGDTLSDPRHPFRLEPVRFPEAVVHAALEPVSVADREKLLRALEAIEREDPTFRVTIDPETGQIVAGGMGELHLEIVGERLEREFRVAATLGAPRVAYRETIGEGTEVKVQFERHLAGKAHFAGLSLRLEAAPEVARFEVLDDLPPDALARPLRPTLLEGVSGALASGGGYGYPLCQVRARLLKVEQRPGESTPLALAGVGALAVETALERAGTVLLEPVMRFEIHLADESYGPVALDLQKRRGQIEESDLVEGERLLRGTVPLAEVFGYPSQLRSLTQGRGSLSLEPRTYARVPPSLEARFRED